MGCLHRNVPREKFTAINTKDVFSESISRRYKVGGWMETLTNLTELYVDEEWRSSYCPRGGLARFWKPMTLPCHLYKVIIQIVRINPVSFLVSAVLRNCLCQRGMTRNSTCTFSFLLGKASSAQQVVQQPEGRVVCLSGLPEWCWPFWVPEGEGSFRDNMHAQRCRTRLGALSEHRYMF